MPKHRIDRINEEMKKELANILLNEIRDPGMKAMVSVTGVKVSTDLKYAKIYLSIFSPDKEAEKATMAAINKAKGFIRRRLSATLNLRNTPELTFIEDTSIDYGMHIDSMLERLVPKTSPEPVGGSDDGEGSLAETEESEEEIYAEELAEDLQDDR